ncbi:MAG: glycosyltransferase [Deltaproteobacteria bacterium]|nr:glycosyltransferase [Deltaproteobacteria bacterium]MBW2008933.1 glycosyltransferase [Deltaproteobacteria bacterium]
MLGSLPPLRALSAYCAALTGALARQGPVTFISFRKIYPAYLYPGGGLQEDRSFPPLECPGLRIHRRLTWYNPATWLREGFLTRSALLHAQWWSLPLLPVYLAVCAGFKARGKPVVFTVHNVHSHDGSPFFVAASRQLFRLGDHFIVHSQQNQAQMTRVYGIDPARVSRIPHGPLGFRVRGGGDGQAVRELFGFGPRDQVVLIFGAIRPYKGVDTALEAFWKLLETHPGTRLLIAGMPWEPWERYARIIRELGIGDRVTTHLRFIPAEEVHRFFLAADLVVLPYRRFESQSGVGAAALSFGKPLIVTRVGGLPELVRDPRFVVPPDDPASLARAMSLALGTPGVLREMRAAGKDIASEMNWSAIARQTWMVYDRVLAREAEPGARVRI